MSRSERRTVVEIPLDRPLQPLVVGRRGAIAVVRVGTTVVGEVALSERQAGDPSAQRKVIMRELGDAVWQLRAWLLLEDATRPEQTGGLSVSVVVEAAGERHDLAVTLGSLGEVSTEPLEVLVAEPGTPTPSARGDVIGLLASGDRVDPGWLNALERAFEDPLVAAVLPYVGGATALSWPRRARRTERLVIDGTTTSHCRLPLTGALVRRSWLEAWDGRGQPLQRILHAGLRLLRDPARVVWAGGLGSRKHHAPRSGPTGPAAADVRVRDPGAPSITVAIASYNRRDRLKQVLEGLAAQSYDADRFEVVVVLDGSNDGSAAMAEALAVPYRLRALEQDNQGLAASRNRGAHAGEHPIVVFLDDDVVPEPELLAQLGAAHQRSADEHVALGHCAPVTDGGLRAQAVRAWWEDHYRRKSEPGHVWSFLDAADGCSSVSRSLFIDSGGFDVDFSGRRQDWEWGVRLLSRGVRFAQYPRARGRHFVDTTFASALRHARNHGRGDVQLARKHPSVRRQLPLASYWGPGDERLWGRKALGWRWPTATARLARATVPLLDGLEAAGMRRQWVRLAVLLQSHAYILGIRDMLPTGRDLRALWESRADDEPLAVPVELGTSGSLGVAVALRPLVLDVRAGGERIASVAPMAPGEQWDWEVALTRAAHAAAAPLARVAAKMDQLSLAALIESGSRS
jgi:glycosyltransferase involved in cell wall biosynthesis